MQTEKVFLKPLPTQRVTSPLFSKKLGSQRAHLLRSNNLVSAAQHKRDFLQTEDLGNLGLQGKTCVDPSYKSIELEKYGNLVSKSVDDKTMGQVIPGLSQQNRSDVTSTQVMVMFFIITGC